MKSYISVSMFKEQLRKLKLPTLILIFLASFFLIMEVVLCVVSGNQTDPDWTFPSRWGLYITPFVAFFLANLLMKDYRKRNGCDFYHALPVSRKATVIASILATMVAIVAFMIIPSIIQLLIGALLGIQEISYSQYFHWFIYGVIVSFYFISASWLGHSLTGTRFSHAVVTLIILFGFRVFFAVLGIMINYIMPYLLLNRYSFFFYPEKYNLFISYLVEGRGATPTNVIYTLTLSLVYIGLALFLIERKPSETAGSPSWSSRMETAVRIVVACAVSIPAVFGLLSMMYLGEDYTRQLYEDLTFVMVVIFYGLTLIIYFLYEIVQTKQIKQSFKHWRGLIGVVAFNLVILLGVGLIHHSAVSTVPTPDQIQSVALIKAHNYSLYDTLSYHESVNTSFFPDKKNQKLFEDLIYDIPLTGDKIKYAVTSELIKATSAESDYYMGDNFFQTGDLQRSYRITSLDVKEIYDSYTYSDVYDDWSSTVALKIKLTSGKTIYRQLNIPQSALFELLEKEEFVKRVGELDFYKVLHAFGEVNSFSQPVNVTIRGFGDANVSLDSVIVALNKDFQDITAEKKMSLLFHPVYSMEIPIYAGDWIGVDINNILEAYYMKWTVSPDVTPNLYDLVLNNSKYQQYKEYWESNFGQGGDANVSN